MTPIFYVENEKGKTTGPSPVTSSTIEYGFTTISLGQMLSAIKTTKTRNSWNTTNIHNTKIPTVKRRKDPIN